MKKLFIIALALTFFACEKTEVRHYETIEVNGLIWMAENLKETTLNDGTPLTLEDGTPYDPSTYPYFCPNLHGYLYTYNQVATNQLCPVGWRMPRLKDFESLVLGLDTMGAGDDLKSTDFWEVPGTNTIGFNAYGSGYYASGEYVNYMVSTAFWTATPFDDERVNVVVLYSGDPFIFWAKSKHENGLSVRCIKSIN
jgi:uncharacterized protein (TIGR02145 family)